MRRSALSCEVWHYLRETTGVPPPWTTPPAPAPRPHPGPALLSGSSFLGPGTFPDAFPPAAPSTPALPEFTAGLPPSSYQSDLPSSLLTPEKSAPCLPGQVSAGRGLGGQFPGRGAQGHLTRFFSPSSDGTSGSPGPVPQPWATGAACSQPWGAPRAPAAPSKPSPSIPAAPGPSELGPHRRAGLQHGHRRDGAPHVWGGGGPGTSPGREYGPHAGEHVGAGAGEDGMHIVPRVHMLHRRENTAAPVTSRARRAGQVVPAPARRSGTCCSREVGSGDYLAPKKTALGTDHTGAGCGLACPTPLAG